MYHVTIELVIKSFRDKATAAIFSGVIPKGVPADVAKRARAKLVMIDAAHALDDLRIPPANHLEKLGGDRLGQHSIRVNLQWRICFTWRDGATENVEFCDYHKG